MPPDSTEAVRGNDRNPQPFQAVQLADALLRIWTVALTIDLSGATIYRMLAAGKFPEPQRVGKRCTRRKAADVRDGLSGPVAQRGQGDRVQGRVNQFLRLNASAVKPARPVEGRRSARTSTTWETTSRSSNIAGEYCKKDSPICFEGQLMTRKWQEKDGKETYTTEIIADQMLLQNVREIACSWG